MAVKGCIAYIPFSFCDGSERAGRNSHGHGRAGGLSLGCRRHGSRPSRSVRPRIAPPSPRPAPRAKRAPVIAAAGPCLAGPPHPPSPACCIPTSTRRSAARDAPAARADQTPRRQAPSGAVHRRPPSPRRLFAAPTSATHSRFQRDDGRCFVRRAQPAVPRPPGPLCARCIPSPAPRAPA